MSTGSYETPVLESESDVETVTIGKYNKAKDIIIVKADSGYETFDDLEPGCKLGVESFSGSTIVWQALAQDLARPDDRRRTRATSRWRSRTSTPRWTSCKSGDLCAGVTSIYNANASLMDGSVVGLYDAKSASQLYGEEYVPGHEGMNSNNFVVLKSWYDEHPEEVAFFLEVWDRGLQEWATNKDAILEAYPEDFGYANDEELAFLKDWYETQFDEFVDTVYLDETWIDGELQVTDLLADAGLVPRGPGRADPRLRRPGQRRGDLPACRDRPPRSDPGSPTAASRDRASHGHRDREHVHVTCHRHVKERDVDRAARHRDPRGR